MYFCTVRLLTLMPSFKSSPRIRSAPHNRFLATISRIKVMVSSATRRSTFPARDRRRQNARNPSRCHRRRVSGCTMARARRHVGSTAAAMRKRSRSNIVILGCGNLLRRITIWCLSMAFSMTSSRRRRTMSAAAPLATPGPAWGATTRQVAPAFDRTQSTMLRSSLFMPTSNTREVAGQPRA